MPSVDTAVAAVSRRRRAIALALAVLVVLAVVGGVVYLETPYRGDPDRLEAIDAREDVRLERAGGDVILSGGPVTDETIGIVVYPGARVDPESYAWTLAPVVAERDVVLVVPEMPLNLAVLDVDAADETMADYPSVDRWIVGGHSLGGSMACRYASENPDRADGLLLLAAYCDDGDDLRGSGVPVLSVQGTADGVIDRETERANRELLGQNARIVEIAGMNHAQFGAYGDQRGDDPATIDDRTARDRLTEAVLEWFDRSLRADANVSATETVVVD